MNKIPQQNQFVSGDYIVYLRDFALSKGVSAKTLVANSNTDLQVLLNPPAEVEEISFHQLYFNLFNALENPYVGVIEFGKGMALSVHGPLGIAIQGARNLAEVAILAKSFYQTRDSTRTLSLSESAEYICLCLPGDRMEYDSLSILVSFKYSATNLLRDHILNKQCVIHQMVEEPDNFPWEMIQGYQIKFGQAQNQILMPREWMKLPIKSIDPELAILAKNKCEEALEELSSQNLVDVVRSKLSSSGNTNTSLQDMAKQLHVSASTLQRRLRELGTTFKQIKLEQRFIEAKRLLFEKQYNLEQISDHLGFCDASSFTKSFKTFTGFTPSSYRNHYGHSRNMTSINQ